MRKLVMAVCALCCATASAQEIGVEIPANQNLTNTSAATTPAEPAAQQLSAAAPASSVPGPRKGEFGIRASFFGSGIPAPSTSSSVPGSATPTLGFRYLATDAVALDFDLGAALGVGNRTPFGFGAGLGVTAYLGSAAKPIRPFLSGNVTVGKNFSTVWDDFTLNFRAGGGAEYWFSDHFSLDGRLLLGVPLNLKKVDIVTFATFEPGVGANFYF